MELHLSRIAPPEMSELDQALEDIIERKENDDTNKYDDTGQTDYEINLNSIPTMKPDI